LSMPTGTTVSVTPTAGASTVGTLSCAATVSPNVVRNSNLAGNHDVVLTGTNCGGAVVEIDVIAPSGSKTSKFFSVP
jgi:hypothetical protein